MSDARETRVLGRIGARELTREELEYVSGAGTLHTNNCTINLSTGTRDGDAC
ncbi:MAG TPA: hypothetical protein VNV88_00635 [Candidatus Solibacter sp.]|jgi:hypothetical protein|nr:hypothetical protein [Candidatus Solibacter sp.]